MGTFPVPFQVADLDGTSRTGPSVFILGGLSPLFLDLRFQQFRDDPYVSAHLFILMPRPCAMPTKQVRDEPCLCGDIFPVGYGQRVISAGATLPILVLAHGVGPRNRRASTVLTLVKPRCSTRVKGDNLAMGRGADLGRLSERPFTRRTDNGNHEFFI